MRCLFVSLMVTIHTHIHRAYSGYTKDQDGRIQNHTTTEIVRSQDSKRRRKEQRMCTHPQTRIKNGSNKSVLINNYLECK